MLYATVRQRKVHVKSPTEIVSDGVNVDDLTLEMDDEWAGMDSIDCIFTLQYNAAGEDGKVTALEISKKVLHTFGQPIRVPWEVVAEPGRLVLSCIGYNEAKVQTMRTAKAETYWTVTVHGQEEGEAPEEATQTLYEQIVAAGGRALSAAQNADTAASELRQAAEDGEFDGNDGKDGEAATIELGTVVTVEATAAASVTNSGTAKNAVFNFAIPRGPQGLPGEKGEQGERGPQGEQGIQGIQGERGLQGERGVQGERGPQGIQGNTGPEGPRGYTGEQGPQGEKGEKGDKGDKGDTGAVGPQGEKGDKGDKGDKGERGETGKGLDILGTYGSVSALQTAVPDPEQGDMYNVGTAAPYTIYMWDDVLGWTSQGQLQGAKGEKGDKGDKGDPGADGKTPVKGTDYFTAADKQEIAQAAAGLVPMDTTLSQTGKAADAKAVGDALASAAKVFITTLEDMAGMYGVDHTFAEIKAARDAGYLCFLNDYGELVPLVLCNDGQIVFTGPEAYRSNVSVKMTPDGMMSVNYQDYISAVFDDFSYQYTVADDIVMQSGQSPYAYLLRNSIINSSEVTPSNNGEIAWVYG